jgi:hypothetical protein
MDALVEELRQQYHFTLGMYESVLEASTDEIWDKVYATVPFCPFLAFWREAYHVIFWLYLYGGPPASGFDPHPFGRDIDPRLFTPPNNVCTREEALQYAARTRAYIDETFGALSLDELSEPDPGWGDEFRTVYHRLMYGLRHGQHHIGRLTVYLDLEGIEIDTWQG